MNLILKTIKSTQIELILTNDLKFKVKSSSKSYSMQSPTKILDEQIRDFNLIPILRDPKFNFLRLETTIQIPTKIQFIFILKFSDFTFYIFN